MHIGFGLYQHMLCEEYYKFARQAGASHIVVHLTDYFYQGDIANDQPLGNVERGWGYTRPKEVWSFEKLKALKDELLSYDLTLEALENIDPIFWYDILLNGPKRNKQIELVKELIRNMGKAGIPVLGYNFSLAGVAGRTKGPYARGGAMAVGMEGLSPALETPIPKGMVWNMIYDTQAPEGTMDTISHQELLNRYKRFIRDVLPVAEASGVKLALHPDDPPLPTLRRQPRLGVAPEDYVDIMELNSSEAHVMELCLGTLAEMEKSNVYEALEYFASNNKIGYIHFRNVKGKVPYYKETFVDDGDINMARVIAILQKYNFKGVIIPDHSPQMSCDAPWHAGMAYAMGYMKGLLAHYNSTQKQSTAASL